MLDASPLPALVCSVVPEAVVALRATYGAARISLLTPELASGIDLSCVDATTVGADRLANTVAARNLVQGAVIVLDCGTAITTEAVDAKGVFRGGAILPGRALQRRALHEHTAQLPEVSLEGARPPGIGVNTDAAIRAGIDVGVLGAVERLVSETRVLLGAPECTVLATGGDAGYFLENLSSLTAAPPYLTLRGLALVADAGRGLGDG